MTFDGVVVAGGAARRLGGIHKPAVHVGPYRLLDVAINALSGAQSIVVVGPQQPTDIAVSWTREDPPGGGPVAAIAAALSRCSADEVVVLAADLPFITSAAIAALRMHRATAVASMAVDDLGRDQPLLACYELSALRVAMPTPARNASMRDLTSRLSALGQLDRVDLSGSPPVVWDCDTDADLERAREQV
jgi:molybdopterin-guanine dinucleotide biosynthesis protein A